MSGDKSIEEARTDAASVQAEHPENNFDFWRVLAASMVLFSHQFALLGKPEPQILPKVTPGTLGVCVFFAISGFLVMQSWQRDPHALRFLWKRVLRIWPGLIAACCIAALVLGPIVSSLSPAEYFQSGATWRYFKTLLLDIKYELPGVFEDNPYPRAVNGSLWTIPVEVRWYLVVLAAGLFGLFRHRAIALTCLVALAAYHFGIYGAETNPRPNFFREYGLFFLAGVCLQLYRQVWSQRLLACAGFTLLGASAAFFLGHPFVALWITVPFAVIAFGLASTPFIRRFGRIGDLSYGIYIYAFPVQQMIIWATQGRYPFVGTLAISALVTTVVAYVSWHGIERPALSLKPSRKADTAVGRPLSGPTRHWFRTKT
ncbi:MAG: acyltransferase [Proteobacteria bacterium]|nr:acyltransferase [Pseudomonadota bacterium]